MASPLTKAALMTLGAACVLLFAGGFPLLGAPDVYRSGAMLTLGVIAGLLALWGAWKLAKGKRARLVLGLFFTFLATTGLVVIFQYGGTALHYAAQGGAMWFGALGMACTAGVGLIFLGLFGYLAKRLMDKRLWLAGAHVALALAGAGAFIDYSCEESAMLSLPADGETETSAVTMQDGSERPLGFRLRIDSFHVTHHDTAPSYSLYAYDAAERSWRRLASVKVDGDELVFGDERWPLADMKTAPRMPQPFLLAGDRRVILRDKPPVKEYRADCRVVAPHRGVDEDRPATLRVNEPIALSGWQLSLMDYATDADGTQRLAILARHAPGRLWALAGMIGLIICCAFWCWLPERRETGKETAHA